MISVKGHIRDFEKFASATATLAQLGAVPKEVSGEPPGTVLSALGILWLMLRACVTVADIA